ncbi:CRISPR-associated protein Cst1 [Marinitoga hydrogenitolerans DSM 16785]|uniref:CRISPR-associated protein Cst1 n=1 Tax=Marinitoga hydrogenitolerans (strain DSM 16785 / JCM 12826 / AT1271) TaxID=1122195 RepID=A0A1M4Z411_MARH1|nr:type I-B CRISPR-associated protein Cas8b1/Cst1 [Marinitoga hydrogenitolerans]SHF12695.1 CRISPR-associated protein Cst1 [Marinitoga hydrogenitolerans DSM 16785]
MGKNRKIKLKLSDWLYNAGIVGIINILGNENVRYRRNNENIDLEFDEIEIDLNNFENFKEKYFNYFIKTYKNLSWYKLVSYKGYILNKKNEKEFSQEDLEIINKIIDQFKKDLKKSSFKSAYELIYQELPYNINVLEEIKNLKKIKKIEKKEEFYKNLEILEKLISFLDEPISKKYIAAKNVMYTVIKNAWEGVSFLNPQTKEKNMYKDYKNYFLEPLKEYISVEDKTNYKYRCFSCGNRIKNLSDSLTFLKNIGFDDARKPSNVWDFINDIYICPICKLVYSCVPAGFTYVFDKGVFVNLNHSVEDIYKINKRIILEIYNRTEHQDINFSYKVILDSIYENLNNSIKYEYSDIQIVKLNNTKYTFNILSKNILLVLGKSKEILNNLINNYYFPTKKGDYNDKISLYEEVIFRVMNNIELYSFINKLMRIKISDKTNGYYNVKSIMNIIKINLEYLKEVKGMKDFTESKVQQSNYHGYLLRKAYEGKGSEHKLSGISYRLLNALKVNNKDSFLDTLLNCYLYVDKPVPKIIIESLENVDEFKTIGYSFVAGLFGKNNEEKGDENNE